MTTEENTPQFPPPTSDTYKQVIAARPTPIERGNCDCTLQVDGRGCTLETSDRDCTLEVDRRVEDSNKESVNHNQAEADESGNGSPEPSTPVQRNWRRHRQWYISGGAILLIVIVVPAIVATKN
ncbi:hypothetical protein N7465_002683 [Penicillium sp. CMV-2018d]|nr:hypothetical protein N7465_002683 [Penicillium sp. CMV-2018d]